MENTSIFLPRKATDNGHNMLFLNLQNSQKSFCRPTESFLTSHLASIFFSYYDDILYHVIFVL